MSNTKRSRPAKSADRHIVWRFGRRLGRAPIFWLHIDHIDNPGGEVWAVRQSGKTHVARKVWINVPLAETVYRKRPQPRAYIRGEGYVQVNDDGSISIN